MPVDKLTLERYRSYEAEVVLAALAEHAKLDLTFKPLKNSESTRWHALVSGKDFELRALKPAEPVQST